MTNFPFHTLLILAVSLLANKGNSFAWNLPAPTLHSSVRTTNLQEAGTRKWSRRTQPFEENPIPSPTSSPIVMEISSHADWLELLHDHDDDRLTIVWFKASFCKTCQRFGKDWNRKVVQAAVTNPRLDVATVDFTENRKLFKQLDVKGLPTVQFYHRGDLLTSFACTHKDFGRVLDSLEYYLKVCPTEVQFESCMESSRSSFKDQLLSIKLNKSPAPRLAPSPSL